MEENISAPDSKNHEGKVAIYSNYSPEEIVYDSDSSVGEFSHKRRFPLLISESDYSISSGARSSIISPIPCIDITLKKANITSAANNLESIFEMPRDDGSELILDTINLRPRLPCSKESPMQDMDENFHVTSSVSDLENILNSSFEPFENSGEDSDYIPGTDESEDGTVVTLKKRMTSLKKSTYSTDTDDNEAGIAIPLQNKKHEGIENNSLRKSIDAGVSSTTNDNQYIDYPLELEKNQGGERDKEGFANKDEGSVFMATSTSAVGTKRIYDKKHACMYCKLLVSKLPRHLEAKHNNEIEVAQFMAQPLNSKQRKLMIEKIRQTGNYIHNTETIASGSGLLIPKRRPNENKNNVNNYISCGYCHGLFTRKYFYSHKKLCALRPKDAITDAKSVKMPLPVAEKYASQGLQRDVLSAMRNDDLYHIIRMDQLILRFGSELYAKLGNQTHLRVYISQRMRQLARLLKEMREINKEIRMLSDILQPKYYNDFIIAVKLLGAYNEDKGTYGIPSMPLKLRTSVIQCTAIYKSDMIIKGLTKTRAELDDYVALIEMNFKNHVSSQALTSSYQTKWNKPTIIPLASDISTLSTYLKEKANVHISQLKQQTDSLSWIKLCEITLVQLLLFNRRRSGEIERMFLETYLKRDTAPMNEELHKTLNEVEKHIAKNLTRIEIRGKKGRRVPILLTNDTKYQVDLLIETREAVGVQENNPYLFASFNSLNHIRSADKLREMAEKSGAKDPKSITSTKLRKHVATAAQLLNLKDNEIDSLATYMGHDIRVHRQYYRLPDSVTQLAKVSKLLIAMDTGNLAKNKNKNFDTMHVDEKDNCPEEDVGHELDRCKGLNDGFIESCTANKVSRILTSNEENWEEIDTENELEQTNTNKIETKTKPKKKEIAKGKKVQKAQRPHQRRTWTPEEKDAMNRQMAVFWLRKKVPNKRDCDDCLSKEPDLNRRSWRDIKNYVYNVIKKNSK